MSNATTKPTLEQRILAGDARAWGRFADRVRAVGGTYKQTLDLVRDVFRRNGKPEPTECEFESMMQEADDLETKG